MAKKKSNPTNRQLFMPNPMVKLDIEREPRVDDLLGGDMFPFEMEEQLAAMTFLVECGVTPHDYEMYYNIFEAAKQLTLDSDDEDDDEESYDFPDSGFLRRHSTPIKEYEPLSDAADRTLVLKIQMKDVKKPPMWREVEVPASFDFMRLHEVIQAVVGLEDCHLWQFNAKAYDDSLLIACAMDTDFSSEPTHEAEETFLTQFLQKNGDKLEYVYDFGDDWIFTVEVKELLAKGCESPVCRKYKSYLNAIEDFGGVDSYIEARRDMEEWAKLSKKEQRKRAAQHGFDTPDEYIDFLDSNQFDPDMVNDDLSCIIN